MWIKWISCEVPVATRERFSGAQRAWSTISDQPGLIGQVGGWDPATDRAHLLGLWTGAEAYKCFMRDRHDAVTARNRQDDSYTAIEIATGEVLIEMAGDSANLCHALEHATLLRVADCSLLPGREEHFIDVQRRIWAPGMAAAGGMLAGAFIRLEPRRYLVTTLWSDAAAHQHYSTQHLPALRSRAAPENDLQSITGHALPLEADWRVLPEERPSAGG
ncbi:YdbC family protein (plasmid) [Streptomyces sp. NBC_01643]|nr:YdbC family protein [Streptomyces sp. NBC_01643]